ncbi:ubiquitin-like protein Pup [Corynebacterium lactis]|uniref:Prokaryotic ubiquitin-like protein Pup n=1 Tax=Corynebacterium lactis RW2-5 TaxID=1408189 RepID=A0A0K2H0H7_9CORY|nr:ubiquitin-like protein Pup [Corynebacterium lactis]ALA67438.1 ubiquitin [Corynebacterium lactis RW2-5]
MAGNTQVFGGGSGGGEGEEFDELSGGGQAQEHVAAADDLLDEIDGLLENNAEEFVRSYVQKGGQ